MILLIFKDKFPQDYAQIVAKAEDFMKSKNHEQDIRFFLSETIDIMLRKLPYADDDNLIAMFQEDMQLRTKLLNENDTVNCFYMMSTACWEPVVTMTSSGSASMPSRAMMAGIFSRSAGRP